MPGVSDGSVVLALLRLGENGGRPRARIYLAPHAGDWRPGVAWYVNRHADFFDIGTSRKGWDGFMQCGGDANAATIRTLAELGLKWREVNTDYLWGGYGLWIPPKPNAKQLAAQAALKAQLSVLEEANVLGLLYCQATEICGKQYAEEHLADSIERKSDGKPRRTGFGYAMDASPGTPWHKHVLQQARAMVHTFPMADGIFWDVAGHTEQRELMAAVAGFVHKRGGLFAANAPSLLTSEHVDVLMAEGHPNQMYHLQWLAIKRPMVYLPVYHDGLDRKSGNEIRAAGLPKNAERDLKICLETGTMLGYNYRLAYEGKSLELLRRYVRLLLCLRHRRMVLDAHALKLPAGVRGNIFRVPTGETLVSIVRETSFCGKGKLTDIAVRVRGRFRRAAFLPIGDESPSVKLTAKDGFTSAAIRSVGSGGLLELR